jgi:hypothetical protein
MPTILVYYVAGLSIALLIGTTCYFVVGHSAARLFRVLFGPQAGHMWGRLFRIAVVTVALVGALTTKFYGFFVQDAKGDEEIVVTNLIALIEIKRASFGIAIRKHHYCDFDDTERVDGIVGTDGDRFGGDKMLGKEGAEAVAKDREVVAGIEMAIKGFGKNPQAFNGPLGFSFFEWLDDASRNAVLCSANATGKAEIIVAKNRHGGTGIIPVSFNRELTKFSGLARDGGQA